jgi:hypothetical protein
MFYPGGLLFTGMIGGHGRMIDALDMIGATRCGITRTSPPPA